MTHAADATTSRRGSAAIGRDLSPRQLAAGLVSAGIIIGALFGSASPTPAFAQVGPTPTLTPDEAKLLAEQQVAQQEAQQQAAADAASLASAQAAATAYTAVKPTPVPSTTSAPPPPGAVEPPSAAPPPPISATPALTPTPTPTTAVKVGSVINVTCSPNPVTYPAATTCAATVGGSASVPTGSVQWTTSGSGTLSASTCALDSTGKCAVTYTPGASDAGTSVTIVGSYAGDAKYVSSAAKAIVSVTKPA
jgi:hypothetical protein